MQAIILAAGQGSRLRPHTNTRPKCMVPLAGKALLHRQMAVLAKAGIGANQTTVIGGYLSTELDTRGAALVLNPLYATTNMVSTLFCARQSMRPDEDLLICYGDIVYEPEVLQTLLNCDAALGLAADRQWQRLWQLRMDEPLEDAETFVMDGDNRVKELGKKPHSYEQVQAQYMGLIKVRGDKVQDFIDAFDGLDRQASYDGKDVDNMYMTSFIQGLIDAGWPVQAALVDGGWLEVDTAEELEIYTTMAADGRLDSYCRLE